MVGDCFGQLGAIWAYGSQSLIFLIIPLVISWKTTFICIILGAPFTVPILLLGKFNHRLGVKNVLTVNEMVGAVKELLEGAKVIMGFGNRASGQKRFQKTFVANQKVTVPAQTLNASMSLLYEPLGMIALFSMLFTCKIPEIPTSEVVVVIWG